MPRRRGDRDRLAAAIGRAAVRWCRGAGWSRRQVDLPVEVEDAYGKLGRAMPIKVVVLRRRRRRRRRIRSSSSTTGARPRRGSVAGGRARYRPTEIVRWFARQGFVVAVPTRIGYGVTGGEDVEDSGRLLRARPMPPGFSGRGAADAGGDRGGDRARRRAEGPHRRRRPVVRRRDVGRGRAPQPARRRRRDQLRRRRRRQPEDERARAMRSGAAGAPVRRLRAQRAACRCCGSTPRTIMYWGAEYPKAWLGGVPGEAAAAPSSSSSRRTASDGHSLFTRFPGGLATGGAPSSCASAGLRR